MENELREAAQERQLLPGVYAHFKGNRYVVITAPDADVVKYRYIDESGRLGSHYRRPVEDWLARVHPGVTHDSGTLVCGGVPYLDCCSFGSPVPRYEYLGPYEASE